MTAARSSASQVAPRAWQNVAASLGGFYAQGALPNGNRYFSKVRSARQVGERLLHLIKRKGPVDHRLSFMRSGVRSSRRSRDS